MCWPRYTLLKTLRALSYIASRGRYFPVDETDPAEHAKAIIEELEKYSPKLAEKPRWLVFNKVDLLLEEEAEERCQHVIDALGWEGPVYQISAFQKMNLDPLCNDIMDFIETLPAELEEEEEKKEVEFKWDTYHKNTLEAHDEFEDDLDDDDWDTITTWKLSIVVEKQSLRNSR